MVAAVVLGAAVWSMLGRPLASPVPDAGGASATALKAAEGYVRERPFDVAGWLAWVGATGQLVDPSASRVDAGFAAANAIAPADPQLLRARAVRLAARGEHLQALDVLLAAARTGHAERDSAYKAMFPLIGTPAFAVFVSQQLSARNGIADDLLQQACRSDVEIGRLALFAQLVVRDHAIADEVLNCVADRAIAQNQTAFAHWLWLNGSRQLPKVITHVFNGDFETLPGPGAFDWRVNPGGEYRDGFSARVRPDEAPGRKGNLLAVRLNTRPLGAEVARQVLALPAGNYRLQYRVGTAELRSANPLSWAVRCGANRTVLTTTAARAGKLEDGWSTHEIDFAVPATCSGQELVLLGASKLAAAEGGRGALLYDDIRISRSP